MSYWLHERTGSTGGCGRGNVTTPSVPALGRDHYRQKTFKPSRIFPGAAVGANQMIGRLGAERTGRIFVHRDCGVAAPLVENRLHKAPRFLDERSAHEKGVIACHHVEQQTFVRVGRRTGELALVPEIHPHRLYRHVQSRLLGQHLEREALIGLDSERECVGRQLRAAIEEDLRHVLELHVNKGRAVGHSLAGAQVERDARPSPVVDKGLERDEGLGVRTGRDVAFLQITGHALAVGGTWPVARTHDEVARFARRDGPQRAQHIQLGFANRDGVERHRRLHRDQREQLQHVILHHVAQRTRRIVVHRACADAFAFGHGYLHVVDVARAPHALEDRVGEAQHEHILDGFLAQVMVDPEDLRFVEITMDKAVYFECAFEVVADGLLDDDAREIRRARLCNKSRGVEPLDAFRYRFRRHGKVVDAIGRKSMCRLDFLQPRFEPHEPVGLVEAGEIVQARGEIAPAFTIEFEARETGGPFARAFTKLLDRHRAPREAEYGKIARSHLLSARPQIIERGNQLALSQVARSPEYHNSAWRGRFCFGYLKYLVHSSIIPATKLLTEYFADLIDGGRMIEIND